MFSGAIVSVIAAGYMVYTSFKEIQRLQAQDVALRRKLEKISPDGNY